MKNRKQITVIIFLLIAILASHYIPQFKYVGTDFISGLHIPFAFTEWQGTDISEALNINTANAEYNFINQGIAYNYINDKGQNLLLIILDAGNFHHPKVCFTGAGYEIRDLPDNKFNLPDRSLKAHNLFIKRGTNSYLSYYWIVIDKSIAHEWIEQKFKQLLFSLFGSQRVGLMVRVDIPAKETEIEEAKTIARQFITDLSSSLEQQQADYIFGVN